MVLFLCGALRLAVILYLPYLIYDFVTTWLLLYMLETIPRLYYSFIGYDELYSPCWVTWLDVVTPYIYEHIRIFVIYILVHFICCLLWIGTYIEIWILYMDWNYVMWVVREVEIITTRGLCRAIIVILILLWHVSCPCQYWAYDTWLSYKVNTHLDLDPSL